MQMLRLKRVSRSEFRCQIKNELAQHYSVITIEICV